MPRRRIPQIITADAMDGLVELIAELNDRLGKAFSPSAQEFRAIVQTWDRNDRNLYLMEDSDRGLFAKIRAAFHPTMIAMKTGYVRISLRDHAPWSAMAKLGATGIRFYAMTQFVALVLNPLSRWLGGPCERCQMYYVKNRLSQQYYCGRKCAHLVEAEKNTNKKLKRERHVKLKRAEALIMEWDTMKIRPDMDWKRWIHGADRTITPKWLTIAVKNYGLQSPSNGGKG